MKPASLDHRLRQLGVGLGPSEPGPLYRQVARRLSEAIRAGALAAGEALPTQPRLAELLGVSQMTVRRAMAELSRSGMIESTRGRGTTVLSAHDSSPTARPPTPPPTPPVGQKKNARLRLGVVFASVADGYPFLIPILTPIEAGHPPAPETPNALHASPITDTPDADRPILQTFYVDPSDHDPASLVRQLPMGELDGLILMSPINTALLAAARLRGLPCVLLFNDLSDLGSTCITCDYLPGIHQAVTELVETGCRRAALVTAGELRYSTGPVRDAMAFCCATLGLSLPEERIVHADYTQQQAFKATAALLAEDDPPDCIVYCSETQAEGGLLAAERLGVAVPGALSIVALGGSDDDSPWARRLSVVDVGLSSMGRLALDAIRRKVRGEAGIPRRLAVHARFIPGQTTGDTAG